MMDPTSGGSRQKLPVRLIFFVLELNYIKLTKKLLKIVTTTNFIKKIVYHLFVEVGQKIISLLTVGTKWV
jgi:hypothetical protein